MENIEYEVKHPFQYEYKSDTGGASAEAKTITIVSFSMKQMAQAMPVKEIVLRAMGNVQAKLDVKVEDTEEAREAREKAKEDAKSVDGGEMMALIGTYCDSGDLLKLHLHMIELLSCGVASVNNQAPLGKNLIDRMNAIDFEALCGAYIGNFMI